MNFAEAAKAVHAKYGVLVVGDGNARDGGYYDVWAHIEQASSADVAKRAAGELLDLIACDRETYLRCEPEGGSDRDFDTKEVRHRGYVRFTTANRPGPRHLPQTSHEPLFCGFGNQ